MAGLLTFFGLFLASVFLRRGAENGLSLQSMDKRATDRSDVANIPLAKSPPTDPNEKVHLALDKFKAEQAKIPEGAAVEQLAALKERTVELQHVATPLPSMTQEFDENGIKWKRLAYPSGEIRYELAE
jgi:hypothetical protein